mmetsp:Transcript_24543/g.46332  ORF Transcript_24543/g.46332 Transcript_24543/m.46332 type:complete len:130 (+) Transcript_24543:136-525(+)
MGSSSSLPRERRHIFPACCEIKVEEEEVVTIFPQAWHEVVMLNELGTAASVLDGQWYRAKDNECIGEVANGVLVWDVQWREAPSTSQLILFGSDRVGMVLHGALVDGHVSFDAQATITWGDAGGCWLRK